ncbi:MAG: outer membrane beta-barrel protein [Bacteroidia bacterium]
MNLKLKISILIVLTCSTISTFAQTDCKNSLYEANKLFEAGQLTECVTLLEPCTKEKKDKEELMESYHLLAQAYQNLGNMDKANFYVKKMLSVKHDYQKYPNIDPMDFRKLVNQYTVSPKFYLGLKFGVNRNSVALKKSYSAYSSTQSYNPSTGFQVGFTGDYRIKPTIGINADLFFSGLKINHVLDNAGGWQQNYNEQQNYIMLNLSGQKQFNITKKLGVYAGAGFGFGYLNSANVFLESTNNETKSLQQATQNPIDSRNKFQTSANGIIGLSMPVAQGMVSLETNFSYFFGTTVNPDKRMDDLNFIFNNQYVNDDVSLRLMMVNLSYKFPLIWGINIKK